MTQSIYASILSIVECFHSQWMTLHSTTVPASDLRTLS